MKIIIETMTLSNKSKVWIADPRVGPMQSEKTATICHSDEETLAEVERILKSFPKMDPEVKKQVDAADAKIQKDYADGGKGVRNL